jgi:Domain of unknown function (DUF5668)
MSPAAPAMATSMPGYDGRTVATSHGGTELLMSDSPSTPDAPDPTVRYEPATGSLVEPTSPPPPPVAPRTPVEPPPPAPPPPWQRTGGGAGRTGSIIFGVILLAIGLWFFADRTLGLEMPRLDWGDLWPLLIIGLGVWIVMSSMRRSRG